MRNFRRPGVENKVGDDVTGQGPTETGRNTSTLTCINDPKWCVETGGQNPLVRRTTTVYPVGISDGLGLFPLSFTDVPVGTGHPLLVITYLRREK